MGGKTRRKIFEVDKVDDLEMQAATTSSTTIERSPLVEDAGIASNGVSPSPQARNRHLRSTADTEESELFSWGSQREKPGHNLALFEEPSVPFIGSFLKAYTTPGPLEREQSKRKKANLGVMLGVYLPTIQHILGVTMFIRLFWVVGMAGLSQTCLLLLLCCLCTFLTCISISAVATNGVVESGGAYFMISRNLGPEFGSAVGILFYLANTVASSMYLIGGVEVLLLYLFPDLTFPDRSVQSETSAFGMFTNNLRAYGTLLLFLEFVIVAMGVRFVQMLAPVSLVCVIFSILACYAGGIEKTLNPSSGHMICVWNDRLLQKDFFMPSNASLEDTCHYCNFSNPYAFERLCPNSTCPPEMEGLEPQCVYGYPGFSSSAFKTNLPESYLGAGEVIRGKKGNASRDVVPDVTVTFFVLLAIYFPAVTGILTGVNMSGDLKNPQASIPGGTIAAQLTTSFVYFSLALVFGAAIDGRLLRDKNGQSLGGGMVVAGLAWPSPWVLLIGSFLSTFGAALQCLCSAPRLLQSIAKDNVIPILKPFAKVTSNNEPFLGLVLTTVIAEVAILIGNMDEISAVVDFFFLMCYAFVNLICVLHSLMGAPNWRPRFRYYHWSLSLLGAFLCFFIMFSTHWNYAILSIVLCASIYKYVEWKGAKKEWGDGFRGLALSTAQYSLQKIEDSDPHPKNWRPQLLLLISLPWVKELVDVRYLNLLNLASQLKAGRGLTVVTSFIKGSPLSADDRKRADHIKHRMDFDMNQSRLRGFAKTVVYGESQILGSMTTLIQSVGLGGLRPNTVLISWPTHDSDKMSGNELIDSEYYTFTDKLHSAVANEMCLLVAKGIIDYPSSVFKLQGTIDVWWIVADGGLCILIAYLLKQHKTWRGCKLRVIGIAQENDNNTKMQTELQQYVYQLRIDAKIMIVELADPEISKNAFERTLLMEERTRVLQQINDTGPGPAPLPPLPAGASRETRISPLVLAEQKEKAAAKAAETGAPETTHSLDTSLDAADSASTTAGDGASSAQSTMNEKQRNDKERQRRMRALDRNKVHKMHTAVRLNEVILEHSANAQLVLLNLPKPPQGRENLDDYVHYMEVLSDKMPRVLFVRGTGKEVITTTS